MPAETLIVRASGAVHCRSRFYTADDSLRPSDYRFTKGLNRLVGEIDAGVWAVSYLLAMYRAKPRDFALFAEPSVTLDGKPVDLASLPVCYLDPLDPLFAGKTAVGLRLSRAARKSGAGEDGPDPAVLFELSDDCLSRAPAELGGEAIRAMAAIGTAAGCEIFCLPWMSAVRADAVGRHLTQTLDVLSSLGKTVILPTAPRRSR